LIAARDLADALGVQVAAVSAPHLATVHVDDVVEHARLIAGWTLRLQQLSAGPFRSDLTELKLDHIQLVRERTTQAHGRRVKSATMPWFSACRPRRPVTAI
jgi:hypothetical protein